MKNVERYMHDVIHWSDFSFDYLNRIETNSRYLLGLCGIKYIEQFKDIEKLVGYALMSRYIPTTELLHIVDSLHGSPLNKYVHDKLVPVQGQILSAVIGDKVRPVNHPPIRSVKTADIPMARIHCLQELPTYANVVDVHIYKSAHDNTLHREIRSTESYTDLGTSKVVRRN